MKICTTSAIRRAISALLIAVFICSLLPIHVFADDTQDNAFKLTLEGGKELESISNTEFISDYKEAFNSKYPDVYCLYYIPADVESFSFSYKGMDLKLNNIEKTAENVYSVTRENTLFEIYDDNTTCSIFKKNEKALGIDAYNCKFLSKKITIKANTDSDKPERYCLYICLCWGNNPNDKGPALSIRNNNSIEPEQEKTAALREALMSFDRYVYYVPGNVDRFTIEYEGYSCDEYFYPNSIVNKDSIFEISSRDPNTNIKDTDQYDRILGNESGKFDYIEVMIYLKTNGNKRLYCLFCWEKAENSNTNLISDISVSNATLFTPASLDNLSDRPGRQNNFSLVLDKGETSGSFEFRAASNAVVTLYNDKTYKTVIETLTPTNGTYTLSFPHNGFVRQNNQNSQDENGQWMGQVKYIGVKLADEESLFSVAAYQRWSAVKDRFLDEPDSIKDYFCIGSQCTGGGNTMTGLYGLEPEKSLIGMGTFASPISLGNFGGYITYYYENPITDNPNNPYGIDFIVYGNSDGGEGFSEPGNVLVSENGTTWYTLAGSDHYDENTKWDYSVTYTKDEATGGTRINGTLYAERVFVKPEDYPLHTFASGEDSGVTMTGVALIRGSGSNAPFPAWGYADVKTNSRGNFTSSGVFGFGDRDARIARNPYWPQPSYNGSYSPPETDADEVNEYGGDGFDLAWAVDSNGLPVDLSSAQIHYIKVQTASFKEGGATGEKSTEVNVVTRTAADSGAVGVTAAPTAITAGGKAVTFADGENVTEAAVSAPFAVNVTAAENANIYINSTRGTSASFSDMPTHKILRIVVQEGKKEPWIGYIRLTESDGPGASSSVITFNGAGGTVNGTDSVTITYTSDMEESTKAFPTATWTDRTFLGWYDAEGNKYEKYDESMPSELKLTAKWQYNLKPNESPTVNVTFRLIGSSLAQLADEKDTIDLADGNYKGAEYQNWIATKKYTMDKGSTMYDLFMLAISDAGLTQEGADDNYVKSITAPKSFGGHKLAEFTNGLRSGWMYTVRGKHPARGLLDYTLNDNDNVVWHYVNDYAYEVADWGSIGGDDFPSLGDGTYHNAWLKAPDTPTGTGGGGTGGGAITNPEDKTEDKTETTLTPEVTANDKGEASAAISEDTLKDTIADAKTEQADVIVIAPDVKGDASKVSVELPKSGVDNIVKQTNADLKVETDIADITIPQKSLDDLAGQSGSNVTISAEVVKDTDNVKLEIAVDGKPVEKLSGGITVSVPAKAENSGNVLVIVNSDGSETIVKKSIVDGKTVEAVLDGSCTVKVVDNSKHFDDTENHWSKDAVAFASSHELFTGTGANTFSPNTPMSRAMLATVLYRLEDAAATGSNPFGDVPEDTWYTDAVTWASSEGIVTGTGSGFNPNGNVTREQLATMLYRYAKTLGMDTSASGDLSKFNDGDKTSAWAKDAMEWAVGSGLISGKGNDVLDPTGSATRAEVAVIMQRLIGLMVK